MKATGGTSRVEPERLNNIITVIANRCSEDKWSDATRSCLANQTTHETQRQCASFTTEQSERFKRALDSLTADAQNQLRVQQMLVALERLKDRMCACKDSSCVQTVRADFNALGEELERDRADQWDMTDDEDRAAYQLADGVLRCRSEVNEKLHFEDTVVAIERLAVDVCACSEAACAKRLAAERDKVRADLEAVVERLTDDQYQRVMKSAQGIKRCTTVSISEGRPTKPVGDRKPKPGKFNHDAVAKGTDWYCTNRGKPSLDVCRRNETKCNRIDEDETDAKACTKQASAVALTWSSSKASDDAFYVETKTPGHGIGVFRSAADCSRFRDQLAAFADGVSPCTAVSKVATAGAADRSLFTKGAGWFCYAIAKVPKGWNREMCFRDEPSCNEMRKDVADLKHDPRECAPATKIYGFTSQSYSFTFPTKDQCEQVAAADEDASRCEAIGDLGVK